ncbi:unnamed protein product [Lampetra fluviatilis]
METRSLGEPGSHPAPDETVLLPRFDNCAQAVVLSLPRLRGCSSMRFMISRVDYCNGVFGCASSVCLRPLQSV